MKKVEFQHEGTKYVVQYERDGNELVVEHDGKTYVVLLATQAGSKRRPPQAAQSQQPQQPAGQQASGGPRSRIASGHVDISVSEGVLIAPMTGTVKEVKVAEGDTVDKDQLVMIMEAMKMDIDIYASASGTVTHLHVDAGDSVHVNQKLLEIE